MVKYIVLDFGMVLAYPTTGNWHITPKFIELVDINKLNREQLKKAFDNNKELLDKKIVNMEEEYNMFFEFYFALQVILPLVKSYGDSSTFTLSPGNIFI